MGGENYSKGGGLRGLRTGSLVMMVVIRVEKEKEEIEKVLVVCFCGSRRRI